MNTADISQGSSGGALLNEKGQVIAVTSGAYAYGNNMYLGRSGGPDYDIGSDWSGCHIGGNRRFQKLIKPNHIAETGGRERILPARRF